jgi:hypothetical protein
MTGKNYNWHKAWSHKGDRLVHMSGVAFKYSDALGWRMCDDTLTEFQNYELGRGVPLHDLAARLMRLTKEADEWIQLNP